MTKSVALFATCLVDLVKPEIGFATLTLLRAAGYQVSVPPQGCCGQANYNGGDVQGTAQLARQWITTFENYDAIVMPSGSCAATIKNDYPGLFERLKQADWLQRAQSCADKTWELSSFLRQYCEWLPNSSAKPSLDSLSEKVTYHDSCSGLRSLGIKAAPRELLGALDGVQLQENSLAESCCGFGGAFCVKQPEISVALADDKIKSVIDSGADTLVGGDWGCLMHLKGRIDKIGAEIQVKHIAEYLADQIEQSHA